MESVRKAAEMVIEEVQLKGNSKCFIFNVCGTLVNFAQFIFTCRGDTKNTNTILLH